MKKAIVTGHSMGLGEEIAKALISLGYEVLGISRSKTPALPDTACQQVALDLSNSAELIAWLDTRVLKDFLSDGRTALLINNAGIVDPVFQIGRQPAEKIAQAISLNVTAVLLLSNAFVELAKHASDKRIVHVSSGAARKAYSGWSVYCATKAALDHHARSIVEDRVPDLRVASVAPGIIDTNMQAKIRASSEVDFPLLETFQDFKKDGALSSPAETAEQFVRYILSDEFGDNITPDIRDV